MSARVNVLASTAVVLLASTHAFADIGGGGMEASPDEPSEPAPAPKRAPAPASTPATSIDPSAAERSEPEPPVRVPENPRAARLSAKLEAGHAFSSLWGIPIGENQLHVGLGVQDQNVFAYCFVDVALGSTKAGLSTHGYGLGFEVGYRGFEPVRFLIGARASTFAIDRATDGGQMSAMGIGAFAGFDVSVYSWGPRNDHGFSIGARIAADDYNTYGPSAGDPFKWGPSLLGAARF